jgi:hypothetical protein
MFRARAFAVLVASALFLGPPTAVGLSGPITLGFAETYTAPDGATRTHRGADVAMAEGASAEAPRTGTVTFAGRVPGPHGGSVLAVTLETADGVVTMLPLADVAVEQGDQVEAGAAVGHVAASGDPSTAASHLHLGLKRGGVYVDPAPLLVMPPAPAPHPAADAAPAASPGPRPEPKASPAAAAPAARPGLVADPSPQVAPDPSSGTAAAVGGVSAGAPIAAAGQSLAPGVSIAPSDASPAAGVSAARSDRRVGSSVPQARAAGARAAVPARSIALSRGLLAPSIGLLAAALFCSALVITRRSLARRIAATGPVSDRLGTLLQHLKAGDTLCGLTSCSGPLPSQSRGH